MGELKVARAAARPSSRSRQQSVLPPAPDDVEAQLREEAVMDDPR